MLSLPHFESPHTIDPHDYYVVGDSEAFGLVLAACSMVADAFGENHSAWVEQAVVLDEALVEACPDRFSEFPALRLLATELGMQADFAAGLKGAN